MQADKIFMGDAEGWVYVMSRGFKVARQKCYNNICSHMHLVRSFVCFGFVGLSKTNVVDEA